MRAEVLSRHKRKAAEASRFVGLSCSGLRPPKLRRTNRSGAIHIYLTRIIHEASTARVDQADLTGVLGLRTLRRGVQPRLGSEALRAPVISVCWTRSLQTFMNNAG